MNNSFDHTDLLQQIAAGDTSAFRRLYDLFNPGVYATINRYIKDQDECREQVQEIFITIWEKRHLLLNIDSLENYIFIMSRNRVLKRIQLLQKQVRLMKQYEQDQLAKASTLDREGSMVASELHEYLAYWQKAIDALPAQQQTVYDLIDRQSQTLDMAAEQLGLAKETVKKHIKLARKSVRAFLLKHLNDVGKSAEALLVINFYIFFF